MDSPQSPQTSLHHIPNSIGWFLTRILGLLFLLDTAFVIFIFIVLLLPSDYRISSIVTLWIIFTVKFIFTCIIAWRLIVSWGGTQYYLKETTLVRYEGFLGRSENIYQLENLKTVVLTQGLIGRWFNYGDIELVFSSSGYKEEIRLTGIFNPKKYERILREYLKPTD